MQPTGQWLFKCCSLICLAALLLLAGCADSSNETTTAGTSAQPDPSQTIAMIYYASDDPFSTAVRAGAEAAAEQFECELEWHLPALGDDASQRERFEQAVKNRVAGICVCPFSPMALAESIALAKQADIPVVTFERPAELAAGVKTFAGTDYFHCGRILVNGIAAAFPDGCRVLLLKHADDHRGSTQRRQGAITTANEKEGIELILSDGTLAELDEEQKIETIKEWVSSAQGEFQAICALTASDTVAAAAAIRRLDPSPAIAVYGFGATPKTTLLIQGEALAAVVLEDPYMMGYSAVMAMDQHLTGDDDSGAPGGIIVTGEHFVDAESATTEDNKRRLETNVRAGLEN